MRYCTREPRPGGRRSIRCPGHDYGSAGFYFVTVVTAHRCHYLGRVAHGTLELTWAGRIVSDCWYALPQHFPSITLDTFVVMPDHVHGIVVISESVGWREPGRPAVAAGSLGAVVRSFKAAATRRIRELSPDHPTVWQRNYYECVLRSADAVHRVRRYIGNNPAKLMRRVARSAGWR